MAFGLTLGKLIFDIPMEGSLALVFLGSAIYLWVTLGLGMFISTFTHTQQQAIFLAWFFMVIFILMSGLFTAIESMPYWAQTITWFNPVAYMVHAHGVAQGQRLFRCPAKTAHPVWLWPCDEYPGGFELPEEFWVTKHSKVI